MKYAGVFPEQPMPLSLATRCGAMSSSQYAWMIAAYLVQKIFFTMAGVSIM